MRDRYLWPDGPAVLRNKLDITDPYGLAVAEYQFTVEAATTLPPVEVSFGGFKDVHRHLFGDVYDWAGETRTVWIHKPDAVFCAPDYIESAGQQVFAELNAHPVPTLTEEFARLASWLTGELNAIHPFREGNGRTMTNFLTAWAGQLSFFIDFRLWSQSEWLAASIGAFQQDFEPMIKLIYRDVGRS